MAIRNIVKEGDERLAKVCRPVEKFDKRLEDLVRDMKDTLKLAEGLGLAAPQIGILRRIVVILDDDGKMFELINPEITEAVGEQEAHEGCLSVPGVFGVTRRPARVTVRAKNVKGEDVTYTREGITAVCFCCQSLCILWLLPSNLSFYGSFLPVTKASGKLWVLC